MGFQSRKPALCSRAMNAYDELVELIASAPDPATLSRYQASAEVKARVEELVNREKTADLSEEERVELDDYLQLEHLMRMVKARTRAPGIG